MTESIDETNIPRYALFRGKRVRIIGYSEGRFLILESDDTRRSVRREDLTFLKPRRKK